jgi:hypothetical protein
MTEKRLPHFPEPPPDARAAVKDAARLMRQGVRSAGASLLDADRNKPEGRSQAVRSPGTRPQGQEPLRRSMGELARAADRFAGRAEEGIKAILWPGRAGGIPPMQPDMVRAVLDGSASDQIRNTSVRLMRQWIKAALALRHQGKAVVLERPLRQAMRSALSDAQPATSAARLFLALESDPPVRISSLARTVAGSEPSADARLALASVLISMLAAAVRRSKAPLDGSGMITAALVLLDGERLEVLDASALERRFEELAALL